MITAYSSKKYTLHQSNVGHWVKLTAAVPELVAAHLRSSSQVLVLGIYLPQLDDYSDGSINTQTIVMAD